MQKLLESITKYPRYYTEGKKGFISYILEWSKENLNNYEIIIEKTKFLVDLRELIKIIFVTIINTGLIILLEDVYYYSYLMSAIVFFLLFPIQFKLIFLLLSIMTPSKNIIIQKKNTNIQSQKEIIITAHYDTVNGILKSKTGIYKEYIKQNLYSISRILGKYILECQKYIYPFIIVSYILFIITYRRTAISTFSFINYYHNSRVVLYSFFSMILTGSLLCVLIIWMINLPIIKKLKNEGADDNTSGVVGSLEIARRLNDIELNYNLKIVLFDNEEKGLIGSSHYVARRFKELQNNNSHIINLDCIGRGQDIYILTEKSKKNYLYRDIINYMDIRNIKYGCSNMDFSDHKPFLNKGINALSFGRYNSKRYLWIKKFPQINWIHGSEDSTDNIDISKINQIVEIIVDTISIK